MRAMILRRAAGMDIGVNNASQHTPRLSAKVPSAAVSPQYREDALRGFR